MIKEIKTDSWLGTHYHIIIRTDSEEPREDFATKYYISKEKPLWANIRRVWREFEQEYWYSIFAPHEVALEILEELKEATNYNRANE